jgi:hypothetical protein
MKDILEVFNSLPDYPGKKKPKNRPLARGEVSAVSHDPLEGIPKKSLTIKGEAKDFYTVGGLAQAVERTALTVRKWERNGWIPAPTYRSSKPSGHENVNTKQKGYRLYSREQVLLVHKALEINGLLGPRNRSWQEPKRWLSFIEHVKANWPK